VWSKALLCGASYLALLAQPARGGVVQSPDVAHTYAVGRVIDHELRWLAGEGALVASVTFSNVDFVTREEERGDDRFDFFLPGVKLDGRTGIFHDPDGVPVAVLHKEIVGTQIRLLPGARILISNRSGTVHLTLTATTESQPGLRWMESNQGSFLPGIFG
jgi:hypothetical protein